ncbi:MAG: hypothetical protein JW913_08595 [Chitinispirillaceae bacterium]|nr:hypothetical protein [Chitinispirillaceae bacterium]
MVPYNKLNGCVSDLTRSLTIDPILSPAFTEAWNDSNATLEVSGSLSFNVRRTVNDTMFEYLIDQAHFVINGITISTEIEGVIYRAYSATYSWGFFNDTIPYLEDMRINGDPQFRRGGVDIYNIFVNGVSGVSDRDRARFLPPSPVTIKRIGGALRFFLSPGSTSVSLYDMIGREIYHTTIPQQSDRPDFLWDGRTRSGEMVAAGHYSIVWNSDGRQNAQRFFFVR